jgi:hypothetical protein
MQKASPIGPQSLSALQLFCTHAWFWQTKPRGHGSLTLQFCCTQRGCALLSQTVPSGQKSHALVHCFGLLHAQGTGSQTCVTGQSVSAEQLPCSIKQGPPQAGAWPGAKQLQPCVVQSLSWWQHW